MDTGRATTRDNTVQIKRRDVVGADGRPQGPTPPLLSALAPTIRRSSRGPIRRIVGAGEDVDVGMGPWLRDPSLRMTGLAGTPMVTHQRSQGAGSMGCEILRFAQDDMVRSLSLMRIWADKSGLEIHYYLPPRQGPTSRLCLACG